MTSVMKNEPFEKLLPEKAQIMLTIAIEKLLPQANHTTDSKFFHASCLSASSRP